MLLSGLKSWGLQAACCYKNWPWIWGKIQVELERKEGKVKIIQIQFLFIKFSKIKLERKQIFPIFSYAYWISNKVCSSMVLQWHHYDLFSHICINHVLSYKIPSSQNTDVIPAISCFLYLQWKNFKNLKAYLSGFFSLFFSLFLSVSNIILNFPLQCIFNKNLKLCSKDNINWKH